MCDFGVAIIIYRSAFVGSTGAIDFSNPFSSESYCCFLLLEGKSHIRYYCITIDTQIIFSKYLEN